MQVRIPVLNPKKHVKVPAGTTHVQFIAMGMAPDFDHAKLPKDVMFGSMLEVSKRQLPAQVLECTLKPEMNEPLILCVMLRTFEEVQGEMREIKGGGAMTVVEVENAVDWTSEDGKV
jgi:hypothetical protein